jgi:hypothetical protein
MTPVQIAKDMNVRLQSFVALPRIRVGAAKQEEWRSRPPSVQQLREISNSKLSTFVSHTDTTHKTDAEETTNELDGHVAPKETIATSSQRTNYFDDIPNTADRTRETKQTESHFNFPRNFSEMAFIPFSPNSSHRRHSKYTTQQTSFVDSPRGLTRRQLSLVGEVTLPSFTTNENEHAGVNKHENINENGVVTASENVEEIKEENIVKSEEKSIMRLSPVDTSLVVPENEFDPTIITFELLNHFILSTHCDPFCNLKQCKIIQNMQQKSELTLARERVMVTQWTSGEPLMKMFAAKNSNPSDTSKIGVSESLVSIPLGVCSTILSFFGIMRSPTNKLNCIVRSVNSLQEVMADIGLSAFGADDMLPLFIYVLIQSQAPHLVSFVSFVEDWSSSEAQLGVSGYLFAQMEIAVKWVLECLMLPESDCEATESIQPSSLHSEQHANHVDCTSHVHVDLPVDLPVDLANR